MIIKNNVNGTWKELYPKTLADNVELDDGRTVQEYKEDVDSRFPDQTYLWEGGVVLSGSDTVIPSKPLSECSTGWQLVWKRVDGAQQFQYSEIPKLHINIASSNAGTRQVLGESGGRSVHKYFYVSDTDIRGHDSNEDGDNGSIELAYVLEY